MLDLAVLADSLGFDVAWLAEIHFGAAFSLLSAPLMAVPAIAQRTKRIRVGTAVTLLPLHQPLACAEQAATADILSGGRLELGVGRGSIPTQFHGFGVPVAENRARFAECLDIIRLAWTRDRFSYEGRFYTVDNLAVVPKPLQRPHPPIVMGGAAGPRAARLAARWADEYNTPFASVEQCRERRAAVAAACEREGREPIPFSLMAPCCVGRDYQEALARVRRRLERSGRDDDPSDLLGQDNVLAGTVEQVVARLREYADAGVERVFLQHLDHADLDMVRLIGEQVVRAFE
jgi:alkanesulfonate monooxygenase SsuD/methylene tetrahydromethanopterin reductase-like flavin-dependent oxidoreductase (luciferase family)